MILQTKPINMKNGKKIMRLGSHHQGSELFRFFSTRLFFTGRTPTRVKKRWFLVEVVDAFRWIEAL
jgi:hypothetical protein